MTKPCDVLLVGASVRALAASALRAGWTPWCADLFGDVDLAGACTSRILALDHYPHGFIDCVRDAPDVPWMYTGGIENAPSLIERMPRRLWGIEADAVRAVRDPRRLQALGLPLPETLWSLEQADRTREWLRKPLRSSGGLEIRAWHGGEEFDPRRHCLQELRRGISCSAVFVGQADGMAHFVGASRQIVGAVWLHARRFTYAGNIGPLPLSPAVESEVRRWGERLSSVFGLRGLFGCDFLIEDEHVWFLEVNPRYTASVEILERATGESLVGRHIAAFSECGQSPGVAASGFVHGKAILYSPADVVFPDEGPWLRSLEMPLESMATAYADIPAAGNVVEKGRPVLTLFAAGRDDEDCELRLREMALDLDRRLWGR